jgi:hypothetical protein
VICVQAPARGLQQSPPPAVSVICSLSVLAISRGRDRRFRAIRSDPGRGRSNALLISTVCREAFSNEPLGLGRRPEMRWRADE